MLVALVVLTFWRLGPIELPRIRHDPRNQNLAGIEWLDPNWILAREEVDTESGSKRETSKQPTFQPIVHGDPMESTIALTFDDGPHPGYTERLLAALRKENIRATFFVVGKQVEANPTLVQAEYLDGHLVENHTFSHATLTRLSPVEIRTEYRACSDMIESLTGKRPAYCSKPRLCRFF